MNVNNMTIKWVEILYPSYKDWVTEEKGWAEYPSLEDIKKWYQYLNEEGLAIATALAENAQSKIEGEDG